MRPPWTTPAQAQRQNRSRKAHHWHRQAPCERPAARLPHLSEGDEKRAAERGHDESGSAPRDPVASALQRPERGFPRHHVPRFRALQTPSPGCHKLEAAARILPFHGVPRQALASRLRARAGAHAARRHGGGVDAALHGRVRARTETTSTERKNAMACPLEASPRLLRPREIWQSCLPYV